MSEDLNQLFSELDESISTHFIDKAIICINSIYSKIQIKQILSSDQNQTLQYFADIYKRIVPLSAVSNLKSFINCFNSFMNHWNGLLSSLNPLTFLRLCKQLNDEGLTEHLYTFIIPATRSITVIEGKAEFTPMIVQILEKIDINKITALPPETWQLLVRILSNEQIENLIDFYISKNKNEKGVSILVSKERSTLTEKVFINASMDFICKFVLSTSKKVRFDVLTISSRIAESMIIEGYNPEVAFDIIPFIVKGKPTDIEISAFYPFWPTVIEYLEKKESVSALFALHSGYKAELVTNKELSRFLKLDEKTEIRYRLASFQISLEMIESEEIQPNMFRIIHDISMTRGNAMLCCLVDHLPTIFPILLNHDEAYAYDIVNTIMNPIPYDQFLPPFVLRFLNSSCIPNPRDERFKFDVERVIYKYMNLTINVTNEIKTLMKKIHMKINMLEVDWFDIPLSNSITLVEDISPEILLEIISQDTLHISFIPNIINKLRETCLRDDKNMTFYNKETVDTRRIFNMSVSTLLKIVELLGLDVNNELEKRKYQPFPIGQAFMGDQYINGSVKFLNDSISPSFLGAFIRSLVNMIDSLIESENEKEKLPSELIPTLLIVADFLSIFMIDQTLIILKKIEKLADENYKEMFNEIETKAINNSSKSYSKVVIEYLISKKGIEETMKIAKEKALNAASKDFEIAKKLAPFIDQPLPNFRTFLAFEGIEKHAEWVEECRKQIDKDQWITAPQKQQNEEEKEKQNTKENKEIEIEEEEEEKELKENKEKETEEEEKSEDNLEDQEVQEKSDDDDGNENNNNEKTFEFKEELKEVDKGIDGFLDGSKYSIISFLNFRSNTTKIGALSQSVSIDEIEDFAMKNSSDDRLVTGFFYYALCHNYHTPKYKDWLELIEIKQTESSLYAASLFLSSLVGKTTSNLQLNTGYETGDEQPNEPIKFKFGELPEEVSEFILKGLKSIGYYVISKELLTFAFQHETRIRWFFIRSIISLDPEHFKDRPLVFAEFTEKQQLTSVYKPFFDNFKILSSFEALISILVSLTRIYFVPDENLLVSLKHFPLVHNCLYSLKTSVAYPPPIQVENEIIDSLLNALSRQKYFPITFFTFFSHTRLTDQQFSIVRKLLAPKTKAASNFFNYLLPSAYFSDIFPVIDDEATRKEGGFDTNSLKQKMTTIDKETAIYFSNKPPSFSRAFYRSLMLPFTPILPQKLIVEVKDLLCEVFPPFSYNALNMWTDLNDIDQIIFQKYPEDILERFKIISSETIDIYKSVMNDSLFDKKKEVSEILLKNSLTMRSNVIFAINVCDLLISFGVDMNEEFHKVDVVNSPQFCLMCVVFCHAKNGKKVKMSDEIAKEVKELLSSEQRKDLFNSMDQAETIKQIVHNLFQGLGEHKIKWSRRHFFKP